jgi:hypothetical protein
VGAFEPPESDSPHAVIEPSALSTGTGYTKIYSNHYAFAALKADGSITAWGSSGYGGSNAPAGTDPSS